MKNTLRLTTALVLICGSAVAYEPTVQPPTYGSGPPASGTGNVGQRYTDSSNGVEYQKIAGYWHVVLAPSGSSAVDISDTTVALSFTSQPTALRNYQRATTTGNATGTTGGSANSGGGSVSVTVTAGVAVSAACAIVDASTAAAVESCGTFSLASGTNNLTVPVSARLGWDYVRLTPAGGTAVTSTAKFGIGEVAFTTGQSLDARMFGRMDSQTATLASLGITPSPYISTYAEYHDSQRTDSTPAWAAPADATAYDSSFVATYLNDVVAKTGVNASLVGYAYGAQPISFFTSGGGGNTGMVSAATAAGSWRTTMMMEGHSDAGGGTSGASFSTGIGALMAQLDGINAFSGTKQHVLGTIPNIDSSQYGAAPAIGAIRGGAASYAATGANNAVALSIPDIDEVDGIHESMTGAVRLATHFARGYEGRAGLDANGDVGPALVSATRASGSNIVTLTFSQAGGTALAAVGTPSNRLSIFSTGSTTGAYALSNFTVVNATTATVQLGTTPADSVALDIWYGYAPDPSYTGSTDGLFDNNTTDGLSPGRAMTISLAAITAAAPTPVTASLAVTTPNSTTATGGSLTVAGTYTGAAPTGLNFTFDGGTYAAASSPTISGGSYSFVVTAGGIGAHSVTVQEASNTGVTATSATFFTQAVPGNLNLTLSGAVFDTSSPKFGTGDMMGSSSTNYAYWPANTVQPGPPFTIEAWFKIASAPTSTSVILGQAGSYAWFGISSAGLPVLDVGNASSVTGTGASLADGAWHHGAVSVAATGGAGALYIDGVSRASIASSTIVNNNPFGVKAFGTGSSSFLQGSLDEVAIFATQRYTATFTPPTAPYTGTETGFIAGAHLDGNGNGYASIGPTMGSDRTMFGMVYPMHIVPGGAEYRQAMSSGDLLHNVNFSGPNAADRRFRLAPVGRP